MDEWIEASLEEVAQINPVERLAKGTKAKKVSMGYVLPFTKKVSTFSIEEFKGGTKFRNGDTLVARITPSLENGKISFVDFLDENEIGFGSTEFIVLRGIEGSSDKEFLYYFASSPTFREVAIASMTGSSGRQRVQNEVVKEFKFLLPPLPEQRAIAEILSALDDKIDLLHRQNETLEALASTLFRQWFIEEAEDDWEERPLSFFGEIVCGKTPSKTNPKFFGGDIPFIKIPDMHGNVFVFNTIDTLSESGMNTQINKTLPAKSICVSCIATVGLVSINTVESQTNQQINSIIPKKPEYRYYLFLLMRRSTDLLTAMASGGTATLNLNTGNFSRINVIFPGEGILLSFHQLIEPLFTKILHNQSQIKTLEELRDTLLPKLMSGEVRVQ